VSSGSDPTQSIAGDHYAELILDHFERQAERKASLEQRGLAVTSTAGGLVTLQFAVSTFAIGEGESSLSNTERFALGISLLLFVCAAVLGLLTNTTRSYTYVSTRQLEALTGKELWRASPDDAKRRIARARVSMLRTARQRNHSNADLLRWAIISAFAAVAAPGFCVALIV
jgi:hypothetical protein